MAEQEVEVGDRVTYGRGLKTITVTSVSDDIKYGKAGFDGVDAKGKTFWGFNEDIIIVAKSKNLEGAK